MTQPDEPCFLQFTSGSTSAPRGVIVTHRNLIANAKAIIKSLEIHPETDRAVSWLPLYHDMGLIGFVIATLVAQIPVVFIPTIAFVKHPGVWMETVHKYRATITFGPNFAFDLAAKRAPKISRTNWTCPACASLAAARNRSIPKTMESFIAAFAPWALSRMRSCRAMAWPKPRLRLLSIICINRCKNWSSIATHYETQNIARPIGQRGMRRIRRKDLSWFPADAHFRNTKIRILNDKGERSSGRASG